MSMHVTNPYGTYRVTVSRVNTPFRMTILSKSEIHRGNQELVKVKKFHSLERFIALGEMMIAL